MTNDSSSNSSAIASITLISTNRGARDSIQAMARRIC